MADVIHQALSEGLIVESVSFKHCCFLDIGTPEGLQALLGKIAELKGIV